MAVTYPLRGLNASVQSWGTGSNFYANLLTSMVPASASYTINNDGQDTTGIGSFPLSEIPGLLSATVRIGGYAMATPALGVYASVASSGGTVAPYTVDVQSLTIALATTGVNETTIGSSGSPATYRSFMPDGFQAKATWKCMVDQNTPLVLPDLRTNTTLNQLVFTYVSGGTVTMPTTNIRVMDVQASRPGKQMVTYSCNSSGPVATAGGILGTNSSSPGLGSSGNPFPLWSLGSSAVGALVLYHIAAGARSITFADSWIKSLTINAQSIGAPVGVECDIQPTGSITIT